MIVELLLDTFDDICVCVCKLVCVCVCVCEAAAEEEEAETEEEEEEEEENKDVRDKASDAWNIGALKSTINALNFTFSLFGTNKRIKLSLRNE